ncbi:MAG: glycosyltransferase, partial [Rhodoferax sp.]|nr:glycosyltransferase [Rhodoferax sp.]
GVPVGIVVLTDGALQGDPALRQSESRAAAALLGAEAPEFWNLPDGALVHDAALTERLLRHIRQQAPDLLLAPSPWERHPDHRQTAALALDVARQTGIALAFYEVGNPLPPNALLDITPHAARKRQAMACFVSQQPHQDYARHIEALNHYRSYTLPASVQQAEAYLLLPPDRLSTELPGLLAAHPVSLAGGGVAAGAGSGPPSPTVTVILRSTDRPTLAQALDSLALQNCPGLQVLVVAAVPGHRSLPPHCGPYPLRLLPTDAPLARAAAANRGLDHARGELLMFLDDDDWLMPGHLARLVQVLQAHPAALAAYTGVALLGPRGEPLGQVLDLPFDGIRQLAGNLTPIHALLFRRRLLELGCRFDESLALLEDWDFWLQAARHTHFVHLPGVSAAYRIHPSSGVHTDPGPSGEPSALIYQKWQASWTPAQRAALMQRVWSHTDLESRLHETQGGLADLQHRLDDALRAQQALQLERADLHRERSDLLERLESGLQQQLALQQRLHDAALLHDRLAHEQQQLEISGQRSQAELEQTRQQLHASRHEITALRASTSWRLTAPLRRLRQWLRP